MSSSTATEAVRRVESPARRTARRRPPSTPAARRLRARRAVHALLYILPAAIVYGFFAVFSGLSTVYLSLLHWDGISPPAFVGVENYTKILQDPILYGSILHALILIIFFAFIPIFIGLVLTALLMGKVRRGMTFYRTIFFLPQVVPLVAVGITWRWMYADDGVVNQALRLIGLDSIAHAWLGDYYLALIALGFIGTWTMSGLCMVLFLSGAQKIDTALYEAARLDGAGVVRQFFSVTVPGVRGEITIATLITTIAALASFDLVYVTTNGGPSNQTTVPGLLVYRLAFNQSQIGEASALAVALTILVIIIVSLIRYFMREKES